MGSKETFQPPFLSRREFITNASRLVAAIPFLPSLFQRRISSDKSSRFDLETQKKLTLEQLWQKENFGDRLRSLEKSFELFGLEADAAREYSGTVKFYRLIEDIVSARKDTRKSRRELFLGGSSSRDPQGITHQPVLNEIIDLQFGPLQESETSDEALLAQQYATGRQTLALEATAAQLAEMSPQQTTAEHDVDSFGPTFIVPEYATDKNRQERGGPFVDPSLGRSKTELLHLYLQKLMEDQPGMDVMLSLVNGYVPAGGESASASSNRGELNIRTDAPLGQSLSPVLFLHEMAHLKPPQTLEQNLDITSLLRPKRLGCWDPRILIETRTEINTIIAKLVDSVTKDDKHSNADTSDPAAMHIYFSDRSWVQLCTGKNELEFPQQTSALIEYAKTIVDLPELQQSPTIDALRAEIGDDDAQIAQNVILTNLDSDPRKLVGLRELLKKYPTSTVLQQWIMKVLADIEHFINDVNLSYCELECSVSLDSISEEDLHGGGVSVDARTVDHRGDAAFAYAQTCTRLTRQYNEKIVTYEDVAQVVATFQQVFNDKLSEILKFVGIDDAQTQNFGEQFSPQNLQCALTLAQIVYDEIPPVNLTSLFEVDSSVAAILKARLIAIAPGIAKSDSSRIVMTFQKVGEEPPAEDQNQGKELERSIINATNGLIRMMYYPSPSFNSLSQAYPLATIAESLAAIEITDEKIKHQLDLFRSISGPLSTIAILAQRVKITEPEELMNSGTSTLTELAHRLAGPFLLGWNYETKTYDSTVVGSLSSGLSPFQGSEEVFGIDVLPNLDVQNILLNTFDEAFAGQITQALEETRRMSIEIQINQMPPSSFADQAKATLTLLRTGITNGLGKETLSESVNEYVRSLTVLENEISAIELVPSTMLGAASKLLLHRIQMAVIGWVSPLQLVFNSQDFTDFRDQYLGSRLESVD